MAWCCCFSQTSDSHFNKIEKKKKKYEKEKKHETNLFSTATLRCKYACYQFQFVFIGFIFVVSWLCFTLCHQCQ